jgi:hypothetical protein
MLTAVRDARTLLQYVLGASIEEKQLTIIGRSGKNGRGGTS